MDRKSTPSLKSLLLAVTATTALGVTGAASAAPSVQLTFGVTQVELSSDFLNALGALGVTPDNVLPGALYTRSGGASVAFPIPTGELDAEGPKLEILHSGGLTLTAGDVRVALTSFIIENLGGALQLTGVVKANDTIVGRIPLFDLELTQAPEVTQPGKRRSFRNSAAQLEIEAVNVTLTDDAAAALNGVFNVTAFEAGFFIGVAEVNARLRDLDH